MTLIEEILLRIELAGGRQHLAKEIESEWVFRAQDNSGRWKKEEEALLLNYNKHIAHILNKTEMAVARRLRSLMEAKFLNEATSL